MNTRTMDLRTMAMATMIILIMFAPTADRAMAGAPQIMQLDPVTAGTCIAVRVPVDQDRSVSGLVWYNNDADLAYPEVLVAAGYDGMAPDLADALVLVENVHGTELGWSELAFGQAVTSPTGIFYVIFRLPEFTEEQGAGIGPGVGYEAVQDESCVFVSAEGTEWIRMVTDKRLMVDPVYVDAGAKAAGGRPLDLLVLPEPGNPPKPEPKQEELPVRTELLAPYPNPFNPQVTIAYALREAADVKIEVFDVRGRKVREIKPGLQPAGTYQAEWHGKDDGGRK